MELEAVLVHPSPGMGVCEDCILDDELVNLEDFEEKEFDEEDFC